VGVLDQLTHSTGALIAFAIVVVLVIGGTLAMVVFIRRANASARAAVEDEDAGPLSLPPARPLNEAVGPPPAPPREEPEAETGDATPQSEAGAGEAEADRETPPVGPLAPLSARPDDVPQPFRPGVGLVESGPPDPARLRLLGLVLGLLAEHTRQEQPPQLGTAIARLGDGDQDMARSRLSTLSLTLMGEDQASPEGEEQLRRFLTDVLEGELSHGLAFSSMPEFQQALNGVSPDLRRKLDTIVWSRNADSVSMLNDNDVEALERVAVAMATALVIDTTYRSKPAGASEAEEPAAAEPKAEATTTEKPSEPAPKEEPSKPEPKAEAARKEEPSKPEAKAEAAPKEEPSKPKPKAEAAPKDEPTEPEAKAEAAPKNEPSEPEPKAEAAPKDAPSEPEPKAEAAPKDEPSEPEPKAEAAPKDEPTEPEPTSEAASNGTSDEPAPEPEADEPAPEPEARAANDPKPRPQNGDEDKS
jgi:hypothetical protein